MVAALTLVLAAPAQAASPACSLPAPAAAGAAPATARPMMGVADMSSERFKAQTGAPVQVLHTFIPKKAGWAVISGEKAGSRYGEMRQALAREPNAVILLSYSPIPADIEGPPAEALAKCANGDFNQYYTRYGEGLAENKLDHIIMRIGWEWDAKFPWGAQKDLGQAKLYGACFANVVKSIRKAYPGNHITFDFNSTMAVTPALLEAGYPGDAYVDVVSVEGYDGRPGKTPEERWAATEKVFNLVRDFGKAHGKKLAFPEWGVMTNKKNPSWGGGDNPYHIQKVCEYAANPANNVAYLLYFDRNSDLADSRLETHPKSLEAFRTYCTGVPMVCN